MPAEIESVQRVRCGGQIHRIRWTSSGPQPLDHPQPEGECAERIDEWLDLGVRSRDVAGWVSRGFKAARSAAPWVRLGLTPRQASAWARREFTPRQARDWMETGNVHSPVEALRWKQLGFDPGWIVARFVALGINTQGLKRASAVLKVPVSDAARLLLASGGDFGYARQSLPVLARVPGEIEDDPLRSILRPRYSSTMTLRLLDRGLGRGDFWTLGGAEVQEEKVLSLLDSGLTAFDLEHGHECGYTPEELTLLAQNLASFIAATHDSTLNLYRAMEAQIDPQGLDADGAERFHNDQQSLRAKVMTEFGGSPDQADSIAKEYLLAGIVSERTSWFDQGIAPKAAGAFLRYGVIPKEAAAWLVSGFTPSEAVTFVEQGIAPGDAAGERRTMAWTEYFGRSRRLGPNTFVLHRESDDGRLREACGSLAAPHDLWSEMYSPVVEKWCLLDGGVVRINAYGYLFGTPPSGIWVIGTTSLRFLCHRLGLQQPPRLRGELTIPEQGELEWMFHDDRRRNWPELSKRLKPLLGLAGFK